MLLKTLRPDDVDLVNRSYLATTGGARVWTRAAQLFVRLAVDHHHEMAVPAEAHVTTAKEGTRFQGIDPTLNVIFVHSRTRRRAVARSASRRSSCARRWRCSRSGRAAAASAAVVPGADAM